VEAPGKKFIAMTMSAVVRAKSNPETITCRFSCVEPCKKSHNSVSSIFFMRFVYLIFNIHYFVVRAKSNLKIDSKNP
jgi:hypothetical protein